MDIITRINWVDVLAITIILRISYVAFREGLSHEIFPLLGSIFIITFTLHYYAGIGQFISQNVLKVPVEIVNFLVFLLLVVIFGVIFKFVKFLLDKIINVQWHPIIEKFGGLVTGVIRASIVLSLVLMILLLLPLSYLQRSIRDKSLTGIYFVKIGPAIYEKLSIFLPSVKMEGARADKESIMKDLISDKSIAPRAVKQQKTPDWEKASHL